MYPRNAASPPRIAIGAVVQISDGAVQTTGCTVRVIEQGGTEGDGAGTTAYSTDGVVLYTPTQAETDQSAFVLIAKKTGCIPASITVVTTASATAGYAGLDWAAITAPTTTVNLSGTTVKTATDVETDTADIQTRLPAALVGGRIDANMGAISSDSVAADNAESFFDGTGYAGTNNVIPTVTTATNVTTVNGLAAGVITAASIATGAIDADALATDAVTEIWAGSTAPSAASIATAVLTTAFTESYNTDGAAPTLTQATLLALQILSESSVSGTTLTVKKLDGSTTAATFTLSDATTPTSITRAS